LTFFYLLKKGEQGDFALRPFLNIKTNYYGKPKN